MNDYAPEHFQYPTTRYSGSKRRFLGWFWEHVKELPFQTVLDVFGGTASVSLLFKRYGKQVHFNDILRSNQLIGIATIENKNTLVSEEDIATILDFQADYYPDYIRKTFNGIYFTDSENAWLDKVVFEIGKIGNRYKRAILMSSLFQACLSKRPFNLFHRANLYIRTADVDRSFGNKTTWEHPFPDLLRRYVTEYNASVFDNIQANLVVGGCDATQAPNGVDLVYLDPPYFAADSDHGTNYMLFYHFLEGLADYEKWPEKIVPGSKILRLADTPEIQRFTRKSIIKESFEALLARYSHGMIALSYHSEGIPSREEIIGMLNNLGKRVAIYEKPHQYVLSKSKRDEVLFIAT